MAGAKRCLGVDAGSGAVKIAEMAIDRGGVRIIRLLSAPVQADPTSSEAERAAAVTTAIRELVKTHKISTKSAVFSIPGQTVVVRHGVRLPNAPGPRFRQIVQFEARQQIPFSPSIIEYQVFDSEDPRELEVLLVGMKKDTNQELMRMVRRMGLRPSALVPSHMALFNGLELERYTPATAGKGSKASKAEPGEQKEKKSGGLFGLGKVSLGSKPGKKGKKGKKGKGEAEEAIENEAAAPIDQEPAPIDDFEVGGFDQPFAEVKAYVNIGSRTTDLAVTQAGGAKNVGFTRPIPVGSSHITAAILKNTTAETFAEAEEIKLSKTAVLSGMFELEADAGQFDRKACEAATAVADRIIAELRRSLDYYISQPYGVTVDAIVLCGGGAQLPYLDNYIEERLGLPVTVARELGNENIKAPSQYTEEEFDFSQYRVALGLAAQGLGISPLTIDFLPPDIRAMRDFGSQVPEMAAMAAAIGIMIFFSAQIGQGTMQAYRQEIDSYQQIINQRRPIKARYDQAQAERKKVEDKVSLLTGTLWSQDFWLRFYGDIQRIKPPEILLRSIVPQTDFTNPIQWDVAIGGEAEQNSSILAFVRDLNQSDYIKDAELSSNAQVFSESFNKPAFRFRILARVQDTGSEIITRVQPEVTPTPDVSRGMLPGMMMGGDMSPEMMMMMMMGMGGGMPPGGMPPGQ